MHVPFVLVVLLLTCVQANQAADADNQACDANKGNQASDADIQACDANQGDQASDAHNQACDANQANQASDADNQACNANQANKADNVNNQAFDANSETNQGGTILSWLYSCCDSVLNYFGIRLWSADTQCGSDTDGALNYAKHQNLKDINEEELVDAILNRVKDMADVSGTDDITSADDVDQFLSGLMKRASDITDDVLKQPDGSDFEYLPMTRLDPHYVGKVRTIELPGGRKTTMKTLAKNPPIFEIEKFLTDEECEIMIQASIKSKPVKSGVFVSKEEIEKGGQYSVLRESYTTTLVPPAIEKEFDDMIKERISSITKIPLYVIESSENITIGHYKPGGYYFAHLDSNEGSRKELPCCFQRACEGMENKMKEAVDCCLICRFGTFLYYLNDVEGGGETAFPFADLTFTDMMNKRNENMSWMNLTAHCYDANVVVKPARGKAIFWYNHFLDGKGYLGGLDKRGYHGGCNVTAGSKWIATNWISSPIYPHRFTPSRHIHEPISESYKRYKESLS